MCIIYLYSGFSTVVLCEPYPTIVVGSLPSVECWVLVVLHEPLNCCDVLTTLVPALGRLGQTRRTSVGVGDRSQPVLLHSLRRLLQSL